MSTGAPLVDHLPEIDRATRRAVRPMPLIALTDRKREELTAWISSTMTDIQRRRESRLERVALWQKTLEGTLAKPPLRRDASHISVPMTTWASAAVRTRVDEGIWGTKPIVVARPVTPGGVEVEENSKQLARFLESLLTSPRGFNARASSRSIISDVVNYGVAGRKVAWLPEDVRLVAPETADAPPRQQRTPRRILWTYIPYKQLVYWNGYGNDVNAMPYVGHEYPRTWHDLKRWETLGYYYLGTTRDLAAWADGSLAGTGRSIVGAATHTPVELQDHTTAELYLDYIVDDAKGFPAALLLDWHVKARRIMRVTWNPYPNAARPLWIVQCDVPPDPCDIEAPGVCQKLEGAQAEADAVHNIAIEAGKRAIHLTLVRAGSALEDLAGSSIIPGEVRATQNIETDAKTLQLGDPGVAAALIALEEHTRLYVTRILGRDEASVGNLESAKRVPGGLGTTIMREGRVIVQNILNGIAQSDTEALYLSVELLRLDLPLTQLVAAVGAPAAEALRTAVFAPSDIEVREQWLLEISAQDAATAADTKWRELVVLTQFLMGVYDKLVGYAQIALQLPPQLREVMETVIARLQNAVRLLLAGAESINNPDEVIPDLAGMLSSLSRVGAAVAGQPLLAGTGAGAATGGNGESEGVREMGGGVT